MTRRAVRGLVAVALVLSSGAQRAQEPVGEWRHYAADAGSSRYSPLDQITLGNVSQLRVVWRRPMAAPAVAAAYPTARASNRYTATPIFAEGSLFVPNGFGLVEAFDPATGRTR